jgi:hypothetical protein
LEDGPSALDDLYARELEQWLPAARVQSAPYIWIQAQEGLTRDDAHAAILELDSLIEWTVGRWIGFENSW